LHHATLPKHGKPDFSFLTCGTTYIIFAEKTADYNGFTKQKNNVTAKK
jgi:hypothetical protein